MVMKKKGQEMSISTLVIIVIAIIVLVLVVLGFTMGWQNLWSKFNIFGGSSGSLADVVSACKIAISTQSTIAYCSEFHKVGTAYYNCQQGDVNAALVADAGSFKPIDCPAITVSGSNPPVADNYERRFCETLGLTADKKDIKINDKTCAYTAATKSCTC